MCHHAAVSSRKRFVFFRTHHPFATFRAYSYYSRTGGTTTTSDPSTATLLYPATGQSSAFAGTQLRREGYLRSHTPNHATNPQPTPGPTHPHPHTQRPTKRVGRQDICSHARSPANEPPPPDASRGSWQLCSSCVVSARFARPRADRPPLAAPPPPPARKCQAHLQVILD